MAPLLGLTDLKAPLLGISNMAKKHRIINNRQEIVANNIQTLEQATQTKFFHQLDDPNSTFEIEEYTDYTASKDSSSSSKG